MLKKGERVFFSDNSENYLARCEVFQRTTREMGLVPEFYGGTGRNVALSNIDGEMRADFCAAQAVVLYFGSPKDGGDPEDHWSLRELKHVVATGVPCLVYVSKDFPKDVLTNHGYNREPNILSAEDDFGATLRRDLQNLMVLPTRENNPNS